MLTNSKEYQMLISDVKEVNEKIKSTTDKIELTQLKKQRSRLYSIKDFYNNHESHIQVIQDWVGEVIE